MLGKDKLLSWFIKNVILPKQEVLDVPGYLTEEITEEGKSYKIRDVLLPESLFIELEGEITRHYSDAGASALYSVGKKFGYRYASILNLPKYAKSKSIIVGRILDYADFLVRYMEAVYASRLKHKIIHLDKIFLLDMWDYMVCRKSGLGFIFSSGACAGIWAWVEDDPAIEGVQTKCQGKGDEHCELICAPAIILEKRGLSPLKQQNLGGLELEGTYAECNSIIPTEYSKNSLQDLVDMGVFEYHKGRITEGGDRYLLCEASLMYLLEAELLKLNGASQVLWDSGYKFGKNFAKARTAKNPEDVICDFLGAFGFGDVFMPRSVEDTNIYLQHFPWTKWSAKSEFVLIRAILSGIIGAYGKGNKKLKVSDSGFTDKGTFYLHLS